jgi:hypothetical protein
MTPRCLGRVVLTDILPRPPCRGLLNPCSLHTSLSATAYVLASDALRRLAVRPPARSEHRGLYIWPSNCAILRPFFGLKRQKKTAPLAPVQSCKALRLQPRRGIVLSISGASAFYLHSNRTAVLCQEQFFRTSVRRFGRLLYVVVFLSLNDLGTLARAVRLNDVQLNGPHVLTLAKSGEVPPSTKGHKGHT